MATIDLIVLGMLKQQPLSAYDIQKQVEYRKISRWVRISTPSIYKKVLQLEEKGYLTSTSVREGKMPEKAVYSLTSAGEAEFERLMLGIADQPIRIFLDLNAVIVNLDSLPPAQQRVCLDRIQANVCTLTAELEDNLRRKQDRPDIPQTAKAVLHQQLALTQAIQVWVTSVQEGLAAE